MLPDSSKKVYTHIHTISNISCTCYVNTMIPASAKALLYIYIYILVFMKKEVPSRQSVPTDMISLSNTSIIMTSNKGFSLVQWHSVPMTIIDCIQTVSLHYFAWWIQWSCIQQFIDTHKSYTKICTFMCMYIYLLKCLVQFIFTWVSI